MKTAFTGLMQTQVQITSNEFYKLGGFSNPELFRNSQGHFKRVDTLEYKRFKENKKNG